MATVIRELLIKFGVKADNKPLKTFEERVEQSTEALEKASEAARGFGAVISTGLKAGFAGITAGIAASTAQIAQQGIEIDRLAARAGISTDAMQKLGFAAESLGEDALTVQDAMQTLGERFNDAIDDPASDAAVQLKNLGLTFKDQKGNIKSNEELFKDLADALKGIDNPTERAARMMTLLGEDGSRLLPIMEGGAAGLEAMGAEAERLGAIMSEDQIKATTDLHKSMLSLRGVLKGFQIQVGMIIIPRLTRLVRILQGWLQDTDKMRKAMKVLAPVLKVVGALIAGFIGAKALGGMAMMIKAVFGLIQAYRRLGLMATLAHAKVLLIPLAIAGLILLLEDVVVWLNGGESAVGDFIDSFRDAPGVLGVIARTLETLKPTLQAFLNDPKTGLIAIGERLAEAFKEVAAVFQSQVLPFLQEVATEVMAIVREVGPPLVKAVMGLARAMWGLVKAVMPALIAGFRVMAKVYLAGFKAVTKALIFAAGVAAKVITAAIPIVTQVVNWVSQKIKELTPVAASVVGTFVEWFNKFRDDILPVIIDFAAMAIEKIKGFIDAIKGAFNTFKTEYWDKFWEGAKEPIGKLKELGRGVADTFKDAFGVVLGIAKKGSEIVSQALQLLGLGDDSDSTPESRAAAIAKRDEGLAESTRRQERLKELTSQFGLAFQDAQKQLAFELGFEGGRNILGQGQTMTGSASPSNTVNGGIQVTIQGQTNMGAADVSRATQGGVSKALDEAGREASNG